MLTLAISRDRETGGTSQEIQKRCLQADNMRSDGGNRLGSTLW
jgi:hypothetical protein